MSGSVYNELANIMTLYTPEKTTKKAGDIFTLI